MESPFILDHGQKGSTADLAGGLTVQFAPYPPSNVFMEADGLWKDYIFIYVFSYFPNTKQGRHPWREGNNIQKQYLEDTFTFFLPVQD